LSDSLEWEMAMILYDIMIMGMKMVSSATKFIFISFNEVTSIDNNRWLGIHTYVLENGNECPFYSLLER
jgi:hypothetical protein